MNEDKDLEEAKNILRSFVRYYRFDEKKTFTERELSQAIEYFAFNDLVSRKKIEDKIKKLESKTPKDINCANDYDLDNEINYKIAVLQELLEG